MTVHQKFTASLYHMLPEPICHICTWSCNHSKKFGWLEDNLGIYISFLSLICENNHLLVKNWLLSFHFTLILASSSQPMPQFSYKPFHVIPQDIYIIQAELHITFYCHCWLSIFGSLFYYNTLYRTPSVTTECEYSSLLLNVN